MELGRQGIGSRGQQCVDQAGGAPIPRWQRGSPRSWCIDRSAWGAPTAIAQAVAGPTELCCCCGRQVPTAAAPQHRAWAQAALSASCVQENRFHSGTRPFQGQVPRFPALSQSLPCRGSWHQSGRHLAFGKGAGLISLSLSFSFSSQSDAHTGEGSLC